MNIVLICPANDENARIAATWAKAAADEHPIGDTLLTCVYGPGVSRTALEDAVSPVDVLVYYGHGHWRKLYGEKDLLDHHNIACAAGKQIAAIACCSARDLGQEAVSLSGVTGYLGFSQDVVFLDPDPEYVFRDAFRSASDVLLSGGTLEEAATRLRSGFHRILDYFTLQGRHDPNAQWGRSFALWNARYLEVRRPAV